MSPFERVGRGLADPSRMRVYPVMLAAVPIALWLAAAASGSGLVDGAGHVVGADFIAFYMAGAFVRDGRLASLGSFSDQSAFQHALAAPGVVTGFTPWINPPFAAFAFAPLAHLPYLAAFGAFSLAGLLTFASLVAFARRRFGLGLELAWTRLALLGLSYFPTVAWLTFGQTSVFSLATECVVVASLIAGRDVVAGLALGCLAWKPQLALGLGVALVLARRWRAVASALASAALFFLGSFVLAPAATVAWLRASPALLAFIRDPGYPRHGLASLYGASSLLFDGISRPIASAVGASLTLLALAALWPLWRRVPWAPRAPSFRLALAATLAVGVLVSPHLYFYDLMLLLLPAALLFSALGPAATREGEGPLVAATAWVYFLGLPSPYFALGELAVSRALTGHPVALQLETVAVAAWAWLVGSHAVRRAEDEASPDDR
jgi:hypothetical protein